MPIYIMCSVYLEKGTVYNVGIFQYKPLSMSGKPDCNAYKDR